MQTLKQLKSAITKVTSKDITLIAVSKSQPIENIIAAINAGQKHFGENYLQEALKKMTTLNNPKLKWHYLGKIQTNKIKDLAKYFDYIHSVDSLKHAEALNKACQTQNKTMPIFLQVNFENEASKSGFTQEQLKKDLPLISQLPNLKLLGLMLIPSPKENTEQRKTFAEFRAYRNHLVTELKIPLPELSMGMSDDFVAALQEDATFIRIGTRIFGKR